MRLALRSQRGFLPASQGETGLWRRQWSWAWLYTQPDTVQTHHTPHMGRVSGKALSGLLSALPGAWALFPGTVSAPGCWQREPQKSSVVVAITTSVGQGALTNKDSEFPVGEVRPLHRGEKQGVGAVPAPGLHCPEAALAMRAHGTSTQQRVPEMVRPPPLQVGVSTLEFSPRRHRGRGRAGLFFLPTITPRATMELPCGCWEGSILPKWTVCPLWGMWAAARRAVHRLAPGLRAQCC